jgi:hypothetical protein
MSPQAMHHKSDRSSVMCRRLSIRCTITTLFIELLCPIDQLYFYNMKATSLISHVVSSTVFARSIKSRCLLHYVPQNEA